MVVMFLVSETHAFQPNDFPLLKRVQLGPDENVAKIFIKEKKAGEVSPEVQLFFLFWVTCLFSSLHVQCTYIRLRLSYKNLT